MQATRFLLYVVLWFSFGLAHSVFAAASGRRWLERLAGRGDRLAYNVIALLHLGIVLWLGRRLLGGMAEFALPWPLRVLMLLCVALGLIVLFLAGRSYDPARFFGLAQLRAGAADRAIAAEPLVSTGMNRLVRHPLYLGLFLLLWGLATSPFTLATALCASVYTLIGIGFEERKLLSLYGPAYAAYRARVPMLIPRLRRE